MPGGKRDETLSRIAAMNKPVANMGASVRQRLLNLSRDNKEDFGPVLTKYGLERVLYRIAQRVRLPHSPPLRKVLLNGRQLVLKTGAS